MTENKYVIFEDVESEKEFLEKCLEQWDISSDEEWPHNMMQLGAMFREMRHRVEELNCEEAEE